MGTITAGNDAQRDHLAARRMHRCGDGARRGPANGATGAADPVGYGLATAYHVGMQRLKTYVVEDSAVIRENLIATLQELTAVTVVGWAEDEYTATRWLSQTDNDADLVIIDIFLKSGSGLGVLQDAAAAPRRRKMVVLSNYATPEMRRKCLALGADRLFDKSTELDALMLFCDRLALGGDTAPSGLT